MTDDEGRDGEVAPGRPDHPARRPAGEPTPDEADERYLTGEDAADEREASEADVVDAGDTRGLITRLLDLVPAWVVDLGAGCLLAATLLTFVVAVYAAYALATGRYAEFDIGPSRTLTFVVVFGLATVFQGAAVRWARRRVRWMWVMLATAMGMLSIVGAPFALPAAACLFVSKRHFSVATPMEVVDDETADEDGDDDDRDEDGEAGSGGESGPEGAAGAATPDEAGAS